MKKIVCIVFLLLTMPVMALEKETTAREFLSDTTRHLYDACTTSRDDALYARATAFCYGYVLSALHYDAALHQRTKEERLFCPKPDTSLLDVVAAFRHWVELNPQYHDELPVEGVMRSAMSQWPCR
ncbi:MAG TPA: hypothetical protein ENG92_05440 [Thiolapillus brandeum]|uniref:Rap1a immunity protein domain-containing protein n=1 Tax=Thiolapillus brandeum TaxID=1076588 RepID=A0A831NYM7_9GAMM|nr:hypothetical protein [Thiolapillus brandeum]